jgi:hypothetical protein
MGPNSRQFVVDVDLHRVEVSCHPRGSPDTQREGIAEEWAASVDITSVRWPSNAERTLVRPRRRS